jgi:transposase
MKIEISSTDLEEIKRIQKSTKDTKVYKKCTFLIGLSEGYTYDVLSSLLGDQDGSTYSRWKTAYISEGLATYLEDDRQGYQGKLTEEELWALDRHLATNSYQRSQDIVRYISEAFHVSYTEAGVVALLHRLGYSHIQVTPVHEKVSVAKQESCIALLNSLKTNLKEDELLLFGDGVHPTHNTGQLRVWAKRGSVPQIPCNSGRDRLNINAVLDLDTLDCTYLESHTINAQETIKLFEKIESKYLDKQTIYIVVDNARYYKNHEVKAFLLNSKIKLIHIPPYSPNLNLIERLWKFMRQTCINSQYSPSFKQFKANIIDFLDDLSPYKSELEALLNFSFQILNPNHIIRVA